MNPTTFNARQIEDNYLITNMVGQYLFLNQAEYESFYRGEVEADSELWNRLKDSNFIEDLVDQNELQQKYQDRKTFLAHGPTLHIFVLTLRCNQTCLYCHASRTKEKSSSGTYDMNADTARQAVDLAFKTTAPSFTIEFQGGEPLLNYPLIKQIVAQAKEKNKTLRRLVEFTLVSNLAAMNEDILQFILDNRIQVCTSIDGPKELHNQQRKMAGGDAFDQSVKWIKRINQAYQKQGLSSDVYHVEALITVTSKTLKYARQIVDTYRELGVNAIYLRPMDPYGFAAKNKGDLVYSIDDYLAFYHEVVDYIIELNLQGEQMLERNAAIFLTKILSGKDPNFLDIRSPCGAGIGQVTYNYDGKIFTCDEARMLYEMGDDFFQIGDVSECSYNQIIDHPTVRSMIIASNLEGVPDCYHCAYYPYCGVCPVHNYHTSGSIHGLMGSSSWCKIHKGIQDYLFKKLLARDDKTIEIFNRWIEVRNRDHYLHG